MNCFVLNNVLLHIQNIESMSMILLYYLGAMFLVHLVLYIACLLSMDRQLSHISIEALFSFPIVFLIDDNRIVSE